MKLTKETIYKLKEIELKYAPSNKMWATGYDIRYITKALAETLGNKMVLIHVPYSNFVCNGPANNVDSDVKGLMPFSKTRKSEDECTTLFYGDKPITRRNYIPFLSSADVYYISQMNIISSADVYYISQMNINDDNVEVNLVKGPNAGMFM